MGELKSCPFCGGNCSGPEKYVRRPELGKMERSTWAIGCSTMHCFVMYRNSKKDAIASWNKRAEPLPAPPEANHD